MATTALCAEKTVSASLTCPVVDGLLKHHLKIKEDDMGAVIAFKEAVSQELVCRFQFDKDNVAVLAAAVDPRHSHLTCFTLRSSHRCRTFFLRRCNTLPLLANQWKGKKRHNQGRKGRRQQCRFLLGIATDADRTSEVDCFFREPQLQPDDDAM